MPFQPSYIDAYERGTLKETALSAKQQLANCCLCPHECGTDRGHQRGFCRASDRAVVSSYGPHFGEEPELVGKNGSGTIFFGYCNMRCVFCQNFELSFEGEGKLLSNESLAEIMLKLQNQYHCHNINLVSPTHFVANILEALQLAVEQGLHIPLVYNSGGYEKVETLKLLDGIVDIYMPDFKYISEDIGQKYSQINAYPRFVQQSLLEMDRQVGGLKTDTQGIAVKGLIIRHLMMPGGLNETKEILQFIAKNLSPDCLINIMNQYYPAHQAHKFTELNQRVDLEDWHAALDYAESLGLRVAL